mmetsp:Transcript_18952/g.30772  ORF Transcript_18952/g.30772 Transcript_18952/m.30772 type:complete len:112 (-) Transcript_18952:45-380(-)
MLGRSLYRSTVVGTPAFRAFASAQSSSSTSATKPRPTSRSARATVREHVWPPEHLPQWKRTTMKVISQWGGLMFFGFFMGIAWLSKAWAERDMDLVEKELSQRRRDRRAVD